MGRNSIRNKRFDLLRNKNFLSVIDFFQFNLFKKELNRKNFDTLESASVLPVTGAKMWLRAQGLVTNSTTSQGIVDGSGNVTQWTDLTGNGNHATYDNTKGTAPTLAGTNGGNSRAGITFDGVQNNLQIGNKALINNVAGATVFVVCKATSIIGASENEVFFMSAGTSDNGRFTLSIDNASNRWRSRNRRLDAYTYVDSRQILGAADVTSSQVMGLSVDYSGGLGILMNDGEIINWEKNLNTAAGNTSATDSKYASIGNLRSTEAGTVYYPFNGVISEVIFYDRALTSTELSTVSEWLKSYYGIASHADYATDAVTTAYLNRLTALGYTQPSATWVTKFNNFIAKQRANGNLAKLDRLGIFETETANPALVDIIVPATSVTLVNSPAWDTKGYTGNGTTQVIQTGFIPSGGTNYIQNDAIVFAYGRKNAVHGGVILGAKDAANAVKLYPRWTDGSMYGGINQAGGTSTSIANYSAFGISYVRRTGAASQIIGINNDQLTSTATASTVRPTTQVYLLAHNNNGATAEYYAGQISMWAAGASSMDVDGFIVDYKTFEAGIGILS